MRVARRLQIVLAVLAVSFALAPPAQAATFDPNAIVFPVLGENHYSDTFDECRGTRCSRRHRATDIMAAKGVPVVAAAEGYVQWIGSECCLLKIDHGGGWATQYIHLNNDTQNPDGSYSDDGKAWGIAPGIYRGAHVKAGQLIGWVGDSGNAEWTSPHLHFEIWKDGSRINPYPYLLEAEKRAYVPPTWSGVFWDDDHSIHEPDIDKLYEAGVTYGCSLNDEFCPEDEITRGEMAAFIARALGLTSMSGVDAYSDVAGHMFRDEIDMIHTAGIAFGCNESQFCPDRALNRDEMAELLVRAFGYDNPEGADFFSDDDGTAFEESINKLAAAGVTIGCEPDRYCPDRTLTRAEMATFFVRALGL